MRIEGFGYTKVGDCGGGATWGRWAGGAERQKKPTHGAPPRWQGWPHLIAPQSADGRHSPQRCAKK